jgi:acetylornithine deacetylase/succinyl-diaminopimelate desuccinylase-like protein
MAVAKIDMRLVPDMTAADALAKLKAHLAKHGFADLEVNMSGGYDPTQTDPDSKLIQTQLATYRKLASIRSWGRARPAPGPAMYSLTSR